MNAASPADSPVFDLPPEFAAALDARGEVWVRHLGSGETFRLAPESEELEIASNDDLPRGQPLREEVTEALAEADAGLGRPWAEVKGELREELPFLAPAAVGGTTDEPFDGYRSGETLEESVLASIADAEAGHIFSLEEARQEMERRHPELRGR
ncbi:hypothetical protein [Alienimonas sp. DA493]|uniref:hypothetical protein n=1 Tax=Alienimonas sp. DA493 TaxID=3373605 RepID=UPI0037542600